MAKAIPPGRDNSPRLLRRDVAQVQHNKTKATALQKQIGSFKSVFEFAIATHPEQSIQIHLSVSSRHRIERVAGIDERAHLIVSAGVGQGRKH
jgi:hypothetical protein